jgi:hypothetical protein
VAFLVFPPPIAGENVSSITIYNKNFLKHRYFLIFPPPIAGENISSITIYNKNFKKQRHFFPSPVAGKT